MLRCRDACGASAPDEAGAQHLGWSWLSITASWRCGGCAGALYRASSMQGHDGVTVDELSPHSRGALPKETASTISPVSVKGTGS